MRFAHRPSVLTKGTTIVAIEATTIHDLTNLFYRLQKKARRTRSRYFIIVDGIQDLGPDGEALRQMIREVLPWRHDSFRFLFSGDAARTSSIHPPGVSVKSFRIPTLSIEDSIAYFSDLEISRDTISEIHKSFRVTPAHLASLRRLVQTGVGIDDVLDQLHDKAPDLFEVEWRSVDLTNDKQALALSIVAFDAEPQTVESLSCDLSLDVPTTQALLAPLTFLVTEAQSGRISYVSGAFRSFAMARLQPWQHVVYDMRIKRLLEQPDSPTSLKALPRYLQQAGQLNELIAYLSSPERFSAMLKHSESWVTVRQQAGLGVAAAHALERDRDLVQFSIQRSAMAGAAGAESWRSEIEARIALGDDAGALALAHGVILKEDRLHLLAVIARTKREQGLVPEPDLLTAVRQLYDAIDVAALGQTGVDIAADLMYVLPDLAISMVEASTNAATSSEKLDLALARLSLATLENGSADSADIASLDTVHERMQNPALQRLTKTTALLVRRLSADAVIAEIEKLELPTDRLYLLRRWTTAHRRHPNAGKVVEYALKLFLKSAEITPDAAKLREIAMPLPFVPDDTLRHELIGLLSSQSAEIERTGPTEDYVRLQLLIARAEHSCDVDAATARAVDTYFYVAGRIDDFTVKTACLARMAAALQQMDHDGKIEKAEGLQHMVLNDLSVQVDRLLESTADHYDATRRIIRALAVTHSARAVEIAQVLNTQARRDRALHEIIAAAVKVADEQLDCGRFLDIIDLIDDDAQRDAAVRTVMDRLADVGTRLQETTFMGRLITGIEQMRDGPDRCRASCLGCTFLSTQAPDLRGRWFDRLLGQLETTWNLLDVGWLRVEIGFLIAKVLADIAPDEARSFMSRTEGLRADLALDASLTALPYLAIAHLSIRAAAGLFPKHLDTESDRERIRELIERVPSRVERVGLLTDMALRYHLADRITECKNIVTQHIRPLISAIDTRDGVVRSAAIIAAAPALFSAHAMIAHELIDDLAVEERDRAYMAIIWYVLHKQPPRDPYDDAATRGYIASYEEVIELCALLDRLDNDTAIYSAISAIISGVVRKDRAVPITGTQRAEIVRRLTDVVSTKLPNTRHIKHDGYVIAAQAQIAQIADRSKGSPWPDFIARARAISNIADRITVLCLVAEAMPSKEFDLRSAILAEAKDLVERIPVDLDRLDHYDTLAATAAGINQAVARECLKTAFAFGSTRRGPGLGVARRRLVDLAYRIDPSFASSCASMIDDDPARQQARHEIRERYDTLELRRRMLAPESAGDEDSDEKVMSKYPQAAWLLLSGLNSGRVSHVAMQQTRRFVRAAAEMPVAKAYPILAWTIENAVDRHAGTDQAATHLRPIFEATLSASQLMATIAKRSSKQMHRTTNQNVGTDKNQRSVLIGAGERDKAWRYFQNWFQEQVDEYLIIVDPFFGPDELVLLQLLQAVQPSCAVQVLTSKKRQDQLPVPKPWDDAYRMHWRLRLSDQEPPDTQVVVVGTRGGGDSPIHDRWLLTKGAGLRLGTSLNSIGHDKVSEISLLTADEAARNEEDVKQFLYGRKKEYQGERIERTLFDL